MDVSLAQHQFVGDSDGVLVAMQGLDELRRVVVERVRDDRL